MCVFVQAARNTCLNKYIHYSTNKHANKQLHSGRCTCIPCRHIKYGIQERMYLCTYMIKSMCIYTYTYIYVYIHTHVYERPFTHYTSSRSKTHFPRPRPCARQTLPMALCSSAASTDSAVPVRLLEMELRLQPLFRKTCKRVCVCTYICIYIYIYICICSFIFKRTYTHTYINIFIHT